MTAATFVVGFARAGAAQGGSVHPADVIALLRDTIPLLMQRDSVLGVSVALIEGDTLLWSEGFGYTSDSRQDRVVPTTLFSLQSISKTYTATGFLFALDRRWFTLDEPVRRAWPTFSVRTRSDPHEIDRITFRELLAHRSGLPHEAPRGSNFDYCGCSLAEHAASIRDVWLLAHPGARYAYSNLGYDVLAYALERRARQPFAAYMRHVLFDPLGMSASTFSFAEAQRAPSFARGQVAGADAPFLGVPMIGAGGMYSNVLDMARFVSFMLRGARVGGKQVLSPGIMRAMQTVQFPVDGQVGGYGLGVFLRRWHGTILVWHTGGGYGYTTAQEWVPTQHLGVVVLTNDGGNGELASDLAELSLNLMSAAHGFPTVPDPSPSTLVAPPGVKVPLTQLRRLEGSYRSYSGLWTFQVENEQLHVRNPGGGDHPLIAKDATEFTDGSDRFRFHLDAGGYGATVDDMGDNGQDFFALNERPGEPLGPSLPEWARLVGTYVGHAYGQPEPTRIFLKNGYLWSSTRSGSKLRQVTSGLFFTVWGESVEFRGDTLWLRGTPFLKDARDR